MDRVTIHYNPAIEWQVKRCGDFIGGLEEIGIQPQTSREPVRINDDPAILFGTTFFKEIEAAPGNWLLVDRASFGDPEYVSLVWNGHGYRGDHKVPRDYDGSRWEFYDACHAPRICPYGEPEGKIVLCGQHGLYSPKWNSLHGWYEAMEIHKPTHFRSHPNGDAWRLPEWQSWDDVSVAITLNSSVVFDAMFRGIRTQAMDQGSMAYGYCGDSERRLEYLERVAWTQWSWEEIREGKQIAHLFD